MKTDKPSERGIHTIEALKGRCRINYETGCWLWVGSSHRGMPRIHTFNPYTGFAEVTTGNRAAWLIAGGSNPSGRVVYRTKCQDTMCVNPAHLTIGTKAEWGAHMAKTGMLAASPKLRAANTANWRKRPQALDMETVREIRRSDETGVAIAQRLNIKPQTVSKIRRGEAYRETAYAASIFSLGAV